MTRLDGWAMLGILWGLVCLGLLGAWLGWWGA